MSSGSPASTASARSAATESWDPDELADMSGLAMAALRADGLAIVDERHGGSRLLICEGQAGDELSGALATLVPLDMQSRVGERSVLASMNGGSGVLSTPLITDSGHRIGSLHAIYRDGAAHLRCEHLPALLPAFGRHIGFILARGACRGSRLDTTNNEVSFPLDDLAHLPDPIKGMTERVAEVMRPLTGATAVGITIWDEDRGVLRALPRPFGATDDVLTASMTGPVTNLRSAGSRVFVTGRPYMSNYASGDPGVLQAYVERFLIDRILLVPLSTGAKRIGVLHLVNKPSDFTTDDIVAAESVAQCIAKAVDLAQSIARMASQQRLEMILTKAAVAIAAGKRAEECLLPAFDQLSEATEASFVALVPLASAPLVRRTGPPDADLERRLLTNAREIGTASLGFFPQQAGEPGWAALYAPVELHGERVATLSVLRRDGRPFTTEEKDVVCRLASLMALMWTAERYQHQLAETARLREREKIADTLHDRVAQILFAAQLGLDTMLERADTAPGDRERMIEVRDLLTKGDTAIRDVIHQLAVAPGAPLARRLRVEVEAVEEEFDVVVRVDLPADDVLRAVPRPVADAMVKVAREGVTNAAKHAGPCRVDLKVRVGPEGALVMSVLDDGLGERTTRDHAPGIGLRSLRRAVEDAGGTLGFDVQPCGLGSHLVATFTR